MSVSDGSTPKHYSSDFSSSSSVNLINDGNDTPSRQSKATDSVTSHESLMSAARNSGHLSSRHSDALSESSPRSFQGLPLDGHQLSPIAPRPAAPKGHIEGKNRPSKMLSDDFFDRLAQPRRRSTSSPPSTDCQVSFRTRSSATSRYQSDPRLAPPDIPPESSLWHLLGLAAHTARLGEFDRRCLGALVGYLEMMCFLHHHSMSDTSIDSAAAHLHRTATVAHLRPLCAPATRLDAAVPFSLVNWRAVVRALDTVEMEPSLCDLPFISTWLPGGPALDPRYEVYGWVQRLARHVTLVRGDALHRLLAASLAPLHGRRAYPPISTGCPQISAARALLAEAVRLTRSAATQGPVRQWRRRASSAARAAAAERERKAAAEAAAACLEGEAAISHAEVARGRVVAWRQSKDEEALVKLKRDKSEKKAVLMQRRIELAKVQETAALQYERWLTKVKQQRQEELSRQQQQATQARVEEELKAKKLQEAAEKAYQSWLQKVDAEKLVVEKKQLRQADNSCETEKAKFQRNQRLFRQWLQRKRVLASQPAQSPPSRPPWQDPSDADSGKVFVLEEQRKDYMY